MLEGWSGPFEPQSALGTYVDCLARYYNGLLLGKLCLDKQLATLRPLRIRLLCCGLQSKPCPEGVQATSEGTEIFGNAIEYMFQIGPALCQVE